MGRQDKTAAGTTDAAKRLNFLLQASALMSTLSAVYPRHHAPTASGKPAEESTHKKKRKRQRQGGVLDGMSRKYGQDMMEISTRSLQRIQASSVQAVQAFRSALDGTSRRESASEWYDVDPTVSDKKLTLRAFQRLHIVLRDRVYDVAVSELARYPDSLFASVAQFTGDGCDRDDNARVPVPVERHPSVLEAVVDLYRHGEPFRPPQHVPAAQINQDLRFYLLDDAIPPVQWTEADLTTMGRQLWKGWRKEFPTPLADSFKNTAPPQKRQQQERTEQRAKIACFLHDALNIAQRILDQQRNTAHIERSFARLVVDTRKVWYNPAREDADVLLVFMPPHNSWRSAAVTTLRLGGQPPQRDSNQQSASLQGALYDLPHRDSTGVVQSIVNELWQLAPPAPRSWTNPICQYDDNRSPSSTAPAGQTQRSRNQVRLESGFIIALLD
ncbi:hypothetical protein RI367_004362 [Sorochytrium milnesiophthora]